MNDSSLNKSTHANIAKISFVIFLFFSFFGTSLPFQERIRDIDEIATSNIINQVVFCLLFLTSCFSLIPKLKDLAALIKEEKFLLLFLSWCLLSVVWSDYSFISLKRIFQYITAVTVSAAFLLHENSKIEIMKYFKIILYPYIILTLLSVFLIPGAKDPQFLTFRGFTSHKNTLGQVSLVCILLCLTTFHFDTKKGKILSSLMLLISVFLLFGTRSSTPILTFVLLLSLGLLLSCDTLFKPLGIGKLFSFVIMISLLGIIIAVIILVPEFISLIPEYFGKDTTFSGRTALWMEILNEAKKHMLTGTGFGGFWVIGNMDLMILFENYSWLPNQAHNGYLDILNETGLVGLSLFTIMVIMYFINLSKLKNSAPWKWFIIAALIINFQETTYLRPRNLMGVMFLFSYLMLYVELIHRKKSAN